MVWLLVVVVCCPSSDGCVCGVVLLLAGVGGETL